MSVTTPVTTVLPPEATVSDDGDTATVSVCPEVAGCTVSIVEAELLIGVDPPHVAVTVRVTVLFVLPELAAAV